MNTISETIITIEKEALDTIHFPPQEVLVDMKQIEQREYEAKRAMKLGNLFNDKVKILFEDAEGIKMLETSVWGMTDNYLIFKRGTMLPLNRIHEIII